MNNTRSIILISLLINILTYSFANDNYKIYSWISNNGNVVISGNKPDNDVDFRVIEVNEPTVIKPNTNTKNIGNNDTTKLRIQQSDLQKLSKSSATKDNFNLSNKKNNLEVQIVSPKENNNVFTKEEYIKIITEPRISKYDKPTFIVNRLNAPSKYEDGVWKIKRPSPGEIKLRIAGHTYDGKDIHSVNEVTFFIKNGWLAQSKNTGNHFIRVI